MPTAREVRKWAGELDRVHGRIGGRFSRVDLRAHAGNYLRGLISRVERKNGWQLAEELGEATPTNLQHFIARSRWDADAVRDDLRGYVAEHLGDDDAVLIVDETGFLKKGARSVGVQRQYSGTAGRVENCQVGVFLAYRSPRGHALIDRALYLPKTWAEDADRRAGAKVPTSVEFATKPAQARAMIRRALQSGVPCRWVTADEVYGGDYQFRKLCEDRGLYYVVAVSRAQKLWSQDLGHFEQRRAEAYAAEWPEDAWRELSCGRGAKGERVYRWAYQPFAPPRENGRGELCQFGLLVRESLSASEKGVYERAYYLALAPVGTPLEKLACVAGCRWAVEECFEQAKQECGLDEYEVRSWAGWHRHVTLSMLAHATLSVIRAGVDQAKAAEQPASPEAAPQKGAARRPESAHATRSSRANRKTQRRHR
jgi:SRSO17 transposase